MYSDDPRMNPNTANIFGHDTYAPYARRTIFTFFGFVIALMLLAMFVGWYFFSPDDVQEVDPVASQVIVENEEGQAEAVVMPDENYPAQAPGNHYEEGTGRSAAYDFFYNMFGGIEDGLEDNPHNLKNVEHLDDMNLDKQGFVDGRSASLAIKEYADQNAAAQQKAEGVTGQAWMPVPDGAYPNSAYDVMGSRVVDFKGETTGAIDDILVRKEDGMAMVLVIREDNSIYGRDLATISFSQVAKQQENGEVELTIAEEQVEIAPENLPADFDRNRYISLRDLEDGQILDFDGKVAGRIDAVLYENAGAQEIYFSLRPELARNGVYTFKLPFQDADIVKNPGGYDIRLTKEQTEALASTLFTKS